ncbi:CpaE family protein [Kineococcus sp. LSe6-4]|uniref:CpaE family protein n=1 Tax=Kineococcus halophytocola TaxID=3234027 RepID=A0ABV4H1V1_9ACTN
MTLPVLLAVPGPAEARLLTGWEPLRREVVVVRRCADVADVLAAVGAGLARAVVLGADLPGCDSETVADLGRRGVGLVVLLPAGAPGEDAERRWRGLGAGRFAVEDQAPGEVAREVLAAAAAQETASSQPPAPQDLPAVGAPGRTLAVWGPHGSCGRTTIAVNVAAELAAAGRSVLLVDADTRAASVGQALGILDDAPSLLACVRAAADGRFDATVLAARAACVGEGVDVLTGAPDGARWGELRPAALRRVLEVGALTHDWTVLDLPGGSDDLAEESGRDAVLATVLGVADVVLVVGAADPVGLQRLARTWLRLPDLAPDAVVVPVVNRVRAAAVGAPPERRVRDLLRRAVGIEDVRTVPQDTAVDEALLAGRTLLEHAARSSARTVLRGLAAHVEDVADAPEPLPEQDPTTGFDPLLARS